MRWQHKAQIMKLCATLPVGDKIYKIIQKNFGRLNADPRPRLATQIEMAKWILDQGLTIGDKRFFEVGTGHKPIVPIGFFLSGATSVITADLNFRLDYDLLQSALVWIIENRKFIESMYREIVDTSVLLNERLSIIERLGTTPRIFLEEANIRYLAPADAAHTGLPDESIDYHFSVTTLEHIPKNIIKTIFTEADRILTDDGLALHFIDPSDHFSHQDKSITSINFLRFTEEEWDHLAGNQFAYCNRLRASDYVDIFEKLPFEIVNSQSIVDNDALNSVRNGFPLNEPFKAYALDDLCTTTFRVMLRKKLNG